ncbi:MAG TPA: YlbF family regulator [Gemmatimonadaceae bacterium]|nr:YlbF family regulator [Gemmatimonadaceae bacterium]
MLEDKARELGRLIGQSPEYKAVKRANDELSANREAVTLLRDLEKLREDAQRMIARGEQPTEEMERQLDELLGQVQGNPVYQAVAVAQENFDKLMMRANEWILDGIKKGAQSSIITLG